MNGRRILGLIVLAGGIAMLLVSSYIKGEVLGGKKQISSAQKKVNQADQLFSISPATKDIGQGITGSAQKKINAAKQEVGYYAQLADQLQIGGFVVIGIGALLIIIPRGKKK